ncbi:MAG TPA: glycosyltransferase [Phycisphaerae bacterium]|nr:glycosyltransferase [Phycisphaerae bacterium]
MMAGMQASDSSIDTENLTLGVISTIGVFRESTRWYTHVSFGRVLNQLGPKFGKIVYLGKEVRRPTEMMDCELDAKHIEVRPGPSFAHSIDVLRKPGPLLKSYKELVDCCDVVFARGTNPFSWYIHRCCAKKRRPISHWLVGNPLELLKMESRFGGFKDKLAIMYTYADEKMLMWMARKSNAALIVNGEELGKKWSRFNPTTVVSSTISMAEYRERDDTCDGSEIRLLFVAFVRPEKGLEYLVRALPRITSPVPIKLSIVGEREKYPAEVTRIETLIEELGVSDQVEWKGYARFGPDLFGHLDTADILVLPTLSEGTPRVLVEGRARSVPIVSTNVGGIPTSVRDGLDGLLVPPKDSEALAQAISRVINDKELRSSLIRNGYVTAKDWCVEKFAERLYESICRALKCISH